MEKNVKLFIFSETFKFAVNSSSLSMRQQWHIPSMVCRFIFPVLNLICNDALEQDKYLLKRRGSLKRFSFHFCQVKRIFFDEFFSFSFFNFPTVFFVLLLFLVSFVDYFRKVFCFVFSKLIVVSKVYLNVCCAFLIYN